VTRSHIVSWFKLIALALALGCGSSSSTQGPTSDPGGSGGDAPQEQPDADHVEPTTVNDLDVSDPGLEVDPQRCATDADCMIGTPRNCCVSFCPEDRQAWSRAAWAAYQVDCAVEECASTESLACEPERDVQPHPQAFCVRQRCVLR
jgi:hypothetical protein